ncbi:flavin reductase family protein [Brevundimonas vitis]|uniref:Flavin reductase family protein n=1 Tax=Brevundimonas vitisensis TaxID=2800818 RepID=A0ABX7BNB8_9CAUL|nr:flavin reductase family protein [Brevundimonas vitisensis]QQQ19070.1 flavin reductase family protein [Brevundimonas vitisensis]
MTLEPLPDHAAAETLAYRRALGTFATGVCVVTADGPQGPIGLTVNSFTSVSLQPRLILWCLDERSERAPVFAAAERFSLHMLAAGDRDRANRFARGDWALQDRDHVRQPDSAPHLTQVLARFDCVIHERLPMGDHIIIVGRVERFEAGPGDGLTYFRGRYGIAAEEAS